MRIDWWSPELAGLVRQSRAEALNVVKGMVRACPELVEGLVSYSGVRTR
jgi:hypothetical protein